MRRLLIALGLCLLSHPAAAAITIDVSGANYEAGSDITVAVTVNGVDAGDLVVVGCASNNNPTQSVSDGTSTLTAGTAAPDFANGQKVQLHWILSSVANGSVTYTCTFGAAQTGRGIRVLVFTYTGTMGFTAQSVGTNLGTAISSGNVTATGTDNVTVGFTYSSSNDVSSEQINGNAADAVVDDVGNQPLWYRIDTAGFTGAATASVASSAWTAAAATFTATAAASNQRNCTLLGVC